MKKKAKQSINKKDFIDLKQGVNKLDKKIDGLDKNILSYKGEVDFKIDDYFQKAEEREKKYHSQIMGTLDEIMGEIKLNREERIVMGYQVKDHEDRIGVLERKLPAFN